MVVATGIVGEDVGDGRLPAYEPFVVVVVRICVDVVSRAKESASPASVAPPHSSTTCSIGSCARRGCGGALAMDFMLTSWLDVMHLSGAT